MAIKLRLVDVRPHDYNHPDPQFNAIIEAFDTVTGSIYDRGNLAYSGLALSGMTQNQVTTLIRDDALAWAADRKAAFTSSPDYARNVTTMAKVSSLIGAEVAVP